MVMRAIILSVAVLFLATTLSYCVDTVKDGESTYDREKGVRNVGTMQFNVAEDRVIEKQGKFYEPEGIDKYFSRKFEKVYENLKSINTALISVEERLTAVENTSENTAKDITAIKTRLQNIFKE